MKIQNAQGICFSREVFVEFASHAPALEILVDIKAIDVAVWFLFDEADDASISFRHIRLLDRQSFTPMLIVWRRGSPRLELLGGIVLVD